MRIISYSENGAPRIGVVTDADSFIPVAEVAPQLPTTLRALVALPDGLARLRGRRQRSHAQARCG
jgi:hypothetical protein